MEQQPTGAKSVFESAQLEQDGKLREGDGVAQAFNNVVRELRQQNRVELESRDRKIEELQQINDEIRRSSLLDQKALNDLVAEHDKQPTTEIRNLKKQIDDMKFASVVKNEEIAGMKVQIQQLGSGIRETEIQLGRLFDNEDEFNAMRSVCDAQKKEIARLRKVIADNEKKWESKEIKVADLVRKIIELSK